MNHTKLIKPVDGKIIPRQDGNGNVPPEGVTVSALTSYWHRLRIDGDVTIHDVEVAAETDAQPKAGKAK